MTKKKYQGHLLVANPNNPKDYLEKSVLLLVTHTDNLAVALQINNLRSEMNLSQISTTLGLPYHGPDTVYYGGNIAQNKIHVIHSLDWRGLSTITLNDHLGITNDISILAAISRDEGPEYFRACSGYWMWENGVFDQMLDPKQFATCPEPYRWEIAPGTIQSVFEVDAKDHWEHSIEASARYRVNEWI